MAAKEDALNEMSSVFHISWISCGKDSIAELI